MNHSQRERGRTEDEQICSIQSNEERGRPFLTSSDGASSIKHQGRPVGVLLTTADGADHYSVIDIVNQVDHSPMTNPDAITRYLGVWLRLRVVGLFRANECADLLV